MADGPQLADKLTFGAIERLSPDKLRYPGTENAPFIQVLGEMRPGAIQDPLRFAADSWLRQAIPIPESTVSALSGESPLTPSERDVLYRDAERARAEQAATFFGELTTDFQAEMGEGAEALSQPERDYAVLVLGIATTRPGEERDQALKELALAQAKLVRKSEKSPLTRAAHGLLHRWGADRAANSLRPGSTRDRLQTLESVIANRMGCEDMRELAGIAPEAPETIFQQFVSSKAS